MLKVRLVRGGAVREETDQHRIEKLLVLGYAPEDGGVAAKTAPISDAKAKKAPSVDEEKKKAQGAAEDVEETFDVETLTNAEIIARLEAQGVHAPKSATKKDLLEIWRVHKA